jgi:16S rRNA (cytidine1402-2'-O)-methyltransferase
MPGTLFVVATPIGNLEDLTFRALRTLREVDLIAAEDTRRTSKLLAHYAVQKPLVSLREHNEARVGADLTRRMTSGLQVALVSDAGTPGIADPGARLVASAREQGIRVVPIPGPSAVVAAVSISGFSADTFAFRGFPPSGGQAREDWLADIAAEPSMIVFFEAPHRIRRTIDDLSKVLALRPIIVLREATKVHESVVIRPNISDIPERGEFAVVVAPSPDPSQAALDPVVVADIVDRMTNSAGFDEQEAILAASVLTGSKPASIRKLIKKTRILAKRRAGPSA